MISRNFSSIDQGLVDELLQFSPNRIGAARKQLRIETNAQILGRIDPEDRRRGAAPREGPLRREALVLHRIDDDRETESEADTGVTGLGEREMCIRDRPPLCLF